MAEVTIYTTKGDPFTVEIDKPEDEIGYSDVYQVVRKMNIQDDGKRIVLEWFIREEEQDVKRNKL